MAYTTTTNIPLKMPTPGTREPANIQLINDNMIQLDGHDHLTGKGVAVSRLRSGLLSNRPAAGLAGAVYFATDNGLFYVDTGSAWVVFLTSGGAATVTGWTLIDPVIRDTAYFGPEPTGTADATITRTGAGALRVDTNLGVGVTPAAWHPDLNAMQAGQVSLLGGRATGANVNQLLANTYYDSAYATRAIAARPGLLVNMDNATFYVQTAPSVAAGAIQTFTTRMSLAPTGTLTLTPDAGNAQLRLTESGGASYAMLCSGNEWRLIREGVSNRMVVGATGTLTLTPDAGQAALSALGLSLTSPDGHPALQSATGILWTQVGSNFAPKADNATALGGASNRWAVVYAVNGTIQTSSLDMKENVRPLDPVAALEAVRSTEVILFTYKQPPPPEPVEGVEPLPAPAAPFEHAGYDAATTDPLLVMDDQSVNPQNTASVVLAALQALLARVEALEARGA